MKWMHEGRVPGWDFLRRLPFPILVIGVLIVGGGMVGAGVFAYRTYDYVQHDNEFCLSCHLMEEAYERFGQSQHRGLGCKACHQPTMVERSQMALTNVVEDLDEIEVHASVPNQRCAACHIEGDPDKWRHIANTAGHRVHFESDASNLQGLQCVECHSTTLHGFAPTDQTCGQAGCHADIQVQLGRMGQFTIHCVACHNFTAPVGPAASVAVSEAERALRPADDQCLSCHVMRTLVNLPPDEPHGAVCATCHKPHFQTTPERAVESCSTAGCHEAPQSLTPFHVGLRPGVLGQCTQCHTPHTFRVDGSDCASCHRDVAEAGTTRARERVSSSERTNRHGTPDLVRASVLPLSLGTHARSRAANPFRAEAAREPAGMAVVGPTRAPAVLSARATGTVRTPTQLAGDRRQNGFDHARHTGIGCLTCHSTEGSHGRLQMETVADCRGCHHSAPVSRSCERCHGRGEFFPEPYPVARRFQFSVAPDSVTRVFQFDHRPHTALFCAMCHAAGPEQDAGEAPCLTCHQPHHSPETNCRACHAATREPPHTARVHEGCTGSRCHADVPFEGVPRTRNFCLSCHTDRADHQTQGNCAQCHAMPEPRRTGESAPEANP